MPSEQPPLERRKHNELLDLGSISRRHSQHGSPLGHGHLLFNGRPFGSQIGNNLRCHRSDGFSSHVRRRTDADLGSPSILSNILLVVFTKTGQRWFYAVSIVTLLLFLNVYNRLSKPINRLQTEAAKSGRSLDNGRELQAAWNRSLLIRVPLLVVSMLAQCLVLLVAWP